MTPRPQQRAPKGRTRDRHDRRAVLDVLLARAERGVITPAEGALLRAHVAEEMRLADENRRAMAGTTQALERHREAADAAIREIEQRAEHRERQLADARAALDRVGNLAADARTRGLLIHPAAVDAALDDDQALAADAAIRARFLAAADSTEARLTEQQREHDVALATAEQRARTAEAALDRVRATLPTEPRPRLGLPNDLAYQQGRHDQADAVREALDDSPAECRHPHHIHAVTRPGPECQ
ncbi:hypothetical protein ACFOOM_10000 [Streptomyces echinoruber]|uniref:hypothetical protein n=1 Tax=Streptomyces echinoruber TaxID=68898 RepID=UPI003612A2EF